MAHAEEPIWKQLEMLVADIQRELAPNARVRHNVKLPGRQSAVERQVDVLVEQSIGASRIVIAIDCKDYSAPVDVKGVDEFAGLLADIGAHKGAIVAPKGFTAAAKNAAVSRQIDLFSPVDTEPHKWQSKLTIPTVCDYRGALMAFGLTTTAPLPFKMTYDFYKTMQVWGADGKELGTPLSAAIARWNEGRFIQEPGEYEQQEIFDSRVTFVDNGYGMRAPVQLYASLTVTQEIYFGYLPISKIRGLRDEITGAIVTNAFTTGALDVEDVTKNWQRISRISDAPRAPGMVVRGLWGWSADD